MSTHAAQLARIELALEAAQDENLTSEVTHLTRLRDSLMGIPTPGTFAKHAQHNQKDHNPHKSSSGDNGSDLLAPSDYETFVSTPGTYAPGSRTQYEYMEYVRQWAKDFDALPDDTPVVVFHATTRDVAAQIASEGLIMANKPMTLARRRFEAGTEAQFGPGSGASGGTYVGMDPRDISGFGNSILAITVPKSAIGLPPEQTHTGAGFQSIGEALTRGANNGAVIIQDVSPENIVNLYPNRREYIPGTPYEELTRTSKAAQEHGKITKHAAPIHPGTGSGQEVHSGGYKTRTKNGVEEVFVPCPRCDGDGGKSFWPKWTCFRCDGRKGEWITQDAYKKRVKARERYAVKAKLAQDEKAEILGERREAAWDAFVSRPEGQKVARRLAALPDGAPRDELLRYILDEAKVYQSWDEMLSRLEDKGLADEPSSMLSYYPDLELPVPIAKHASPTHGTGTSQKVHGNWAHPGYTDTIDPDSGDLTVTPYRGSTPHTQTAFFHPDLFDSAPNLPTPVGHSPNLDAPFTKATPHGDAFVRLDGKKFLFTRGDGPVFSDNTQALAKVRLPGYIDNFRDVGHAQAITEIKAMREHFYEVEQYMIATTREHMELTAIMRSSAGLDFTSEQKLQYNLLSNHIEAARSELTSTLGHMDQMAGRALPEVQRIGNDVRREVEKAWAKAHTDMGIDAKFGTYPVFQKSNVRHATADEIVKALPNDSKLQDLYGQYQAALATPIAVIPDPKDLPVPEWVKVPRQFTQTSWPGASEAPAELNRWGAEGFLNWHNSQDSLPADTEWRPTDGTEESAKYRWVKASDYRTMVNDAVRLQRQQVRTEHSRLGLLDLDLIRARAHTILPDRREVALKVLEKYRSFGGSIETINQRTGKGQKHLQSEAKFIPTAWIDTSNHYGKLLVFSDKNKRGHYGHDKAGVSRVQAEVGSFGREHVTLHEFAHRVEATNPMVLALERHFYDKRTKGEPLQSLQKLQPGHKYKPSERSRPDEFLDPYKGKPYGQRGSFRTHSRTGQYWTTESYELLSMGIFEAYTDKYAKDEDFMSFIYGTMATA